MAIQVPARDAAEVSDGRPLLARIGSYLGRFIAPLPPIPPMNHRGRFTVFMGFASVVSAILLVLTFTQGPAPGWLALAFVVACMLSWIGAVQVVPGGSLWTPVDFFTFCAIFILGPWGALSSAVGVALGYAIRRRPGVVLVANHWNHTFQTGMIGLGVFRGFQAWHAPGGSFLAALLVGGICECASLGYFMLSSSLGQRKFVGWSSFGELSFTLPFNVGYAWAALGAANLYQSMGRLGPLGLSMVAIPVILFQGFLIYLARQVSLHQLEIEAAHQERVSLLQDLVAKQRGFVADAAHEMRTPLTTMSGGLEIMHEFPDMDPVMKQGLVSDALAESRRLTSLVDSLLELAQLDAPEQIKRIPFDWSELMPTLAEEVKALTEPRGFTAEIAADLGAGVGDARWLKRMFAIVGTNVSVHTPPESAVTFAASREEDGTVRIELTDNGPGVPSDMLDRIFERFVQIDTSRHDAAPGLGLAIARTIASAHDGTIGAEENTPQGLRVVVRIGPSEASSD